MPHYVKTISSASLDVHNILQCHQSRIKPCPQETVQSKYSELWTCGFWLSRQTDTHYTRMQYFSFFRGWSTQCSYTYSASLLQPFKSFINRKLNEKSRPEHIMSANSSDQSTGATTLWDLQDTSPRIMENVGNKLNLAPTNFCNWQLFFVGLDA